MKKLNKKGFTLVELIATIVIIALVMGIGGYSITSLIKSSKETDYKLLITNIKSGVEEYYQECKYASSGVIDCPSLSEGYYNIKLGDLVKYGFLKGNSNDTDDNFTLVNPNDNVDISGCLVKYKYDNGKIVVEAVTSGNSCPTTNDYS